MKIYYEESDLVSFGEYLLSDDRKKSFRQNNPISEELSVEERLKKVYDSDMSTWKEKQKTV